MSDETIPPRSVGDELEKWLKDRIGRATASNIWRVLKRTKTGWSAERHSYKIELIAERLTGMRQEVFLNSAMLHGVETEPDALRAYGEKMGVEITQLWFCNHPRIPMSGASPDGGVGREGLIEAKCPLTRTHLETLLSKEIPERYQHQMTWQLACDPKRQWVDFVSFDNRLPPEFRMYIQRWPRDEKKIKEAEEIVADFLEELDGDMKALGDFTPLPAKQGDGREVAPVCGWSENLPPEAFSSVQSLIDSGLVKKGVK